MIVLLYFALKAYFSLNSWMETEHISSVSKEPIIIKVYLTNFMKV